MVFGIFISQEKAVFNCIQFARDARIEILFGNGNYAAFMVFLRETDSDFRKNISKAGQTGAIAMIKEIDRRIFIRDFSDDSLSWRFDAEPTWKPNLNAKRNIVINNQLIMSWNPDNLKI